MDPGTLLSLAALALVDSTSIGTLVVPLWMLATPGPIRAGRLLVYLATIATFYLGVGVLLLVGSDVVLTALDGAGDLTALRWVQLALGGALFAWAVGTNWPDRARQREERDGRGRSSRNGGRLARWRERLVSGDHLGPVVVTALGAGLLEVATMVPYLAAIGLLVGASVPLPTSVLLLAAYGVVMVLPAVLLLGGRLALGDRVVPALARTEGWFTRNAPETTEWIVAIAGFLLARDALARLGLGG